MQNWKNVVGGLSDDALLEETRACAANEREETASLVAHLAEVYRRDLALKRGFPSLRDYARQELGLSDRQAGERVNAARLALQMPEVIEQIASGKLTLCAASALWSTLKQAEKPIEELKPLPLAMPMPAPAPAQKEPTLAEKRELLGQVLGKSAQESKALLQNWEYERRGIDPASRPRPPSKRRPDGTWTELSFFQNDTELTDWDKLRDLLSHKLGTRDPQAVFEWLKQLGLEKLDPARKEARIAKRAKQRDTAVQRHKDVASRRRDYSESDLRKLRIQHQGKCQHTDPRTGRKCESTAYIDIDHKIPLSAGGKDVLANLTLACASHNRRRPRWSPADQPTYALGESPPPRPK
jgi:5-methylcytosine-specific restriction endonuclease McrA